MSTKRVPQLPCDVPPGTATSFRGVGFDTEMRPSGTRETLFFHIGDGPGYERFTAATPEAVEEFCGYWQSQIDTAREYLRQGCNPNTHEWAPPEEKAPDPIEVLRHLWEDMSSPGRLEAGVIDLHDQHALFDALVTEHGPAIKRILGMKS